MGVAVKRRAAGLVAGVLARTGMLRLVDRAAVRLEPARTDGRIRFPFVRRRREPSVQVLLYHRVADESGGYLPVTPTGAFRGQMAYLAENFEILALDEAAERLERRDLPPRALAITFDDGYRDNFQHAFPVLREFGLTATVFLATEFVGSDRMLWHDRVFGAFRDSRLRRLEALEPGGGALQWDDESSRTAACLQVLRRLRSMDERQRNAAVDRIFECLEVEDRIAAGRLMLTWDEVREMAASGIRFGSHTASHPILTQVPRERAQREILDSKAQIERQLGVAVTTFAYPNGKATDFDATTKELLRTAGYRFAVTTIRGVNRSGRSWDPLEMRRTDAWEQDPALFAARIHLEKFLL